MNWCQIKKKYTYLHYEILIPFSYNETNDLTMPSIIYEVNIFTKSSYNIQI